MKIAAVREYALALPETAEAPHFNYAAFRVRGKIFVTVPPAETHIHVFVGEEEREPALALYAEFVEKLFWGEKAIGLRVELAKAKPAVVRQLVHKAWETKAPKTLLAKIAAR
ncbi:MAG: MmcQ/YjbR family DNA-binding protein [Rudaea sp.]|nr:MULTISPECIES: MmcQ/YjbR family DNA-binding protein [unclassified Rudaea]MBN8886315.1 MmcQ/YjbR family DNA-binding protein [Rudaea sp.]MBR0347895.1 MmcQ/YjbR family DNA-binding protein [Rudaea sp.]